MTKQPYSQIAVRRPWRVIGLWVLFIVCMIVSIKAFPKLKFYSTLRSMIMSNDPDRAADKQAKEIFGNDEMIVVAVNNPKGIFNIPTLTYLRGLSKGFQNISGVREVYSLTHVSDIRGKNGMLLTDDLITKIPSTAAGVMKVKHDAEANPRYVNWIYSKDEKTASINVELNLDHNNPKGQGQVSRDVYSVVHKLKKHKPANVKVYVTGFPIASYLSADYMMKDMGEISGASMLILLLLMFLSFRNWQGVVFTQIVVMAAATCAFGAMSLLGVKVTMPLSGLPAILTAIGMEYSVYVGFAYRSQVQSELEDDPQAPRDHRATVSRAVKEVRRAVVLSALTTAAGFSSMITNQVPDIRKMGAFLALGTLLAGFASLTVVPALISLKPFKVLPADKKPGLVQPVVDRIAKLDTQHPGTVLTCMGLLFVAGVYLVLHINTNTDAMQYFRKTSPIRVSESFVRKHMAGTTLLPCIITANKVDAFKDPKNLRRLEKVEKYAQTLPHVTYTASHAEDIMLINRALHNDDPKQYRVPDSRAAVEQELLLHKKPQDFRLRIDSDYKHANVVVRMDTMSSKVLQRTEKKVEAYMRKVFPAKEGFKSNMVGTVLLVHRAFDVMADSMLKSLAEAAVMIWIIMMIGLKSVKLGTLSLIPNLAPAVLVYATLPALGRALDPPTSVAGAISLGIAIDDTTHMFRTWMVKRAKKKHTAISAVNETLKELGRPMVFSSLVLAVAFSMMMTARIGAVVWIGIMLSVVALQALVWDLFCTPALLTYLDVKDHEDDEPDSGGEQKSKDD